MIKSLFRLFREPEVIIHESKDSHKSSKLKTDLDEDEYNGQKVSRILSGTIILNVYEEEVPGTAQRIMNSISDLSEDYQLSSRSVFNDSLGTPINTSFQRLWEIIRRLKDYDGLNGVSEQVISMVRDFKYFEYRDRFSTMFNSRGYSVEKSYKNSYKSPYAIQIQVTDNVRGTVDCGVIASSISVHSELNLSNWVNVIHDEGVDMENLANKFFKHNVKSGDLIYLNITDGNQVVVLTEVYID